MNTRTSITSPIRVDFLPADFTPPGGRLGITIAPGKKTPSRGGLWVRDLELDLAALRNEHQADVIVTLLEEREMARLGIPDLLAQVKHHGMESIWLPIPDVSTPASVGHARLAVAAAAEALRQRKTVVVHCNGGLGRSGLVAACILTRLGHEPQKAIDAVRRARPGAIETLEQERFVFRFAQEAEQGPVAEAVRGRPAKAGSPKVARGRRLPGRALSPEVDRVRGALYGLAVGDALGAATEFMSPDQIRTQLGRVVDLVASGAWAKGEWTDDTELTLFTAAAYAGADFSPEATAERMVRWMQSGPKDIGGTTAAALRLIANGTATWENAGRLALRGRSRSAANGSLMRAAPTGLVRRPDDARLVTESIALSAITHADPRCLASCVAFNVVLSHLVHRPTVPLGDVLAAARDAAMPVDAETATLVDDVRAGKPLRYAAEDRYDGSVMGFVLLCLERALATLRDASDYETSVLRVVNLGGDADTNAAVAGALLGAKFGSSQIPARWLGELLRTDEIEDALTCLVGR